MQIEIVLQFGLPLLILDDFNCILNDFDKQGGKPFQVNRHIREFRGFIRRSGWFDLGFREPKYTWCNNRMGKAQIGERIDRVFATKS